MMMVDQSVVPDGDFECSFNEVIPMGLVVVILKNAV